MISTRIFNAAGLKSCSYPKFWLSTYPTELLCLLKSRVVEDFLDKAVVRLVVNVGQYAGCATLSGEREYVD